MDLFRCYWLSVLAVWSSGCHDHRLHHDGRPDAGTVASEDSAADTSASIAVSADPARFGIRELPRFWLPAMRAAGITSQDGAAPVPMGSGVLWTFGDTFVTPGQRGLSNSALRLWPSFDGSSPTARYLVNEEGSARPLLPLVEPETWEANRVWPGGGLRIDGATFVYYEVIRLDGATGGEVAHSGVVRADDADATPTFARLARDLPVSPIVAAVRDGRGTVYVYGIEKDGFDSHVVLGRVPEASIGDSAAYRIVDQRLIDDVFGQVSVAWNDHVGAWVMLHPGNPFDAPRTVEMRMAEDPAGPWSAPTTVAMVPGAVGEDWQGLLYVPYLHPELFREKGRIMAVTFCLVGDEAPYLIEVSLR